MRVNTPEIVEAASRMLSTPLQRLTDTSSYVRCQALKTLSRLAEEKVLRDAFNDVAAEGLHRLLDKNANVRKCALQLFATLLEMNPFCPAFPRETLEERREDLLQSLTAEQASAAVPGTEAEEGAEGTRAETESEHSKERNAALALVEKALAFEETMSKHLTTVMQFLSSQTSYDVVEAMNAIVTAHRFELQVVDLTHQHANRPAHPR